MFKPNHKIFNNLEFSDNSIISLPKDWHIDAFMDLFDENQFVVLDNLEKSEIPIKFRKIKRISLRDLKRSKVPLILLNFISDNTENHQCHKNVLSLEINSRVRKLRYYKKKIFSTKTLTYSEINLALVDYFNLYFNEEKKKCNIDEGGFFVEKESLSDSTLILGQSGKGATSLAYEFLLESMNQKRVIVDHEFNFGNLKKIKQFSSLDKFKKIYFSGNKKIETEVLMSFILFKYGKRISFEYVNEIKKVLSQKPKRRENYLNFLEGLDVYFNDFLKEITKELIKLEQVFLSEEDFLSDDIFIEIPHRFVYETKLDIINLEFFFWQLNYYTKNYHSTILIDNLYEVLYADMNELDRNSLKKFIKNIESKKLFTSNFNTILKFYPELLANSDDEKLIITGCAFAYQAKEIYETISNLNNYLSLDDFSRKIQTCGIQMMTDKSGNRKYSHKRYLLIRDYGLYKNSIISKF